jgi:hypothetical protein
MVTPGVTIRQSTRLFDEMLGSNRIWHEFQLAFAGLRGLFGGPSGVLGVFSL